MGSIVDAAGGESLPALERPKGAEHYDTDGSTHRWNEALFDHVARNKDRLLEKALEEDYDGVLFVDSDLVLDPSTVWSMLRAGADLTSAVFWTFWNQDSTSLGPNVWLRHPYEQTGLGMRAPEFWHRLATRRVTPIAGGGACILVSRRAIERGLRYFPRLAHLPDHGMYRGEDRSFAIKAKQMHLSQVADPWPDIWHLYHPQQRTPDAIASVEEECYEARPSQVSYGDLVSLSLETLEEPQLAGRRFNVRGRMGGLEVLPEIEQALLEMRVGEQRILNLRYPLHWPVLGGQQRMAQIELVDAKPYGYAPMLADHVYRGLEPPISVL